VKPYSWGSVNLVSSALLVPFKGGMNHNHYHRGLTTPMKQYLLWRHHSQQDEIQVAQEIIHLKILWPKYHDFCAAWGHAFPLLKPGNITESIYPQVKARRSAYFAVCQLSRRQLSEVRFQPRAAQSTSVHVLHNIKNSHFANNSCLRG
jgi:hypothetical protein